MAKVSVVICCFNAAHTIEAACRSVPWADEVVVVDSGSTDRTPQIARRYAHQFIVEPWRGFTEQKKFAMERARNDWVLVLDHDEECSEELGGEIAALDEPAMEKFDLFMVRRRNYTFGRPIRSWWPDWQSRLIHRRRAIWADDIVNDARLPSHPSRLARLRGCLLHRRTCDRGFAEYFDGAMADARNPLLAAQMYRRGHRCRWTDLVFRPWVAFCKHYVLKRGFLDGTFGLLIAQKAATAVQLKYAALWAMQNGYLGPLDDPAIRR